MWTDLRRSFLFVAATMLLFGGAYPAAVWIVARSAFPAQAEGSLVRNGETVVGSKWIAQKFARPEYFQPRPSAVGYDAASTGGSNYGPSNPDHLAAIRSRIDEVSAREHVTAAAIPSEMVTTSGSGIDPDIPPDGAAIQAARVAAARHVDAAAVLAELDAHVEPPFLGIFGRDRVNVLELNLALDRRFGRVPH